MKKALKLLTTLLFSILLVSSVAVSSQALTHGSSPTVADQTAIIDGGDMFSPEQESLLAESITGNQTKYGLFFVIETVTTLDGQNLEAVALARANELGVGEANKDNGVFIFLSRDDRKIRFELGKGVTSKVSDQEMVNIIDTQVTPQFKANNYSAGITAGMSAVGNEYAGTIADGQPTSNNSPWLVPSILISLGIPVFLFLLVILYSIFGKQPRQERREKIEREQSYERLGKIQHFVLRYSQLDEYSTLPNEKHRFLFLQTNYPEIAETLQTHFSSETPTTRLIDRSFYDDTNSFFISWGGDSDCPWSLRNFKLTGKGFEGMSINDANKIIRTEKAKYLKDKEKALKKDHNKKERARKIWEAIPEPTQKALKKAKGQSARLALLAEGNASDFAANYALIASMFLSSGSSSSSSSGSSGSSRSSSGSSSSIDSSSGSYGGGGFDGGGGSGSW